VRPSERGFSRGRLARTLRATRSRRGRLSVLPGAQRIARRFNPRPMGRGHSFSSYSLVVCASDPKGVDLLGRSLAAILRQQPPIATAAALLGHAR
jgi:hypothetical protein